MFQPFRGLLFDPARISDIGAATSPPYDVIDSGQHEELLKSSDHNVVRLILSRQEQPDYRESAMLLARWRDEQLLRLDPDPRFYLYLMDYAGADGVGRTARGVLGGLWLEEVGDRILGHEETIPKHRADRMNLLTATQANLDVIIGLSSSSTLAGLLEPPGSTRLDFTTPDGIRHRLFDVADPEQIRAISVAVGASPVAIADGHHRYSTALAYRQEHPDVPGSDRIMALVTPAEGSGMTVGPYHRVFPDFPFSTADVSEVFVVTGCEPEAPRSPADLVVVSNEGARLLSPRPEPLAELVEPWREAGTAIARELLYPLLGVDESTAIYVADAAAAVAQVVDGGAAVLVAPITERAIGLAGEMGVLFPQKSTFFIPKPRAGLVMRGFDAEA